MTQLLEASVVRAWMAQSVDLLGRAREEIDRLNVYPVPDGDTGTNLYLTVEAGFDAADTEPATAGLVGILIAPITTLSPYAYSLFLVPALAAALVGNFTNIGVTDLGGGELDIPWQELVHIQQGITYRFSDLGLFVPASGIIALRVINGSTATSVIPRLVIEE